MESPTQIIVLEYIESTLWSPHYCIHINLSGINNVAGP